MKRPPPQAIAAIVIVTLVTALILARGWWQPLLGLGTGDSRYLGYVEGETSLIAPPIAGRLVQRPVERGTTVKKGDLLFVIDPVQAKAEVVRVEASLAESKSRYTNLLSGKRQEEQDVTRSQRREAEAQLAMSETELSSREFERGTGECHAGPGSGESRPEQRLDPCLAIRCDLSLDELRVSRGLGWIVSACHVHFNVAEAMFRVMVL